VYGLRVLLSIINEANTGSLRKVDANKWARKEIRLCRGARMNELFAVAVLQGLIVPREFLLQPIIPGSLCKLVREMLFDNNPDMSNERIKKSVERVANTSGLNMMVAEHALTEAMFGSQMGSPTRVDMIIMKQDFMWMEEYTCISKDEIIHFFT
jgi:hypothetical protein